MKQEFTSTINWEGKMKLCKVFAKTDKKGNTYFLGDLTKSAKLLIQEQTGQYAKPGEHQVSIVPVVWKKAAEQAPPKPKYQEPTDEDYGYIGEELPF